MGACCSSEEPKRHKKKKKVPKQKKEDECCGSCFGTCCAGGGCACCGEDGEEQAINTGRILTLESMGFDQDGNLRHGFNRRDRLGEMQLIIGAEQQVKKKETNWAIVDATWLYQWLAYVNCKDGSVPAPGPCHNFRLVRQHEDGVYYPRLGLVMEKNEKMGDYRKISIKSWQILKELYPGSYPDITATFDYYDISKGEIDPQAEDGYYSTDSWVVNGMKKRRRSTATMFERFGIGHAAVYEGEDEAKDEAKEEEKEAVKDSATLALDGESEEGVNSVGQKGGVVETAPETAPEPNSSEEEGENEGGAAVAAKELPAAPEKEGLLAEDATAAGAGENEATAVPPLPEVGLSRRDGGSFYDSVFNRSSEKEEGNL